jgi:hypothetical protein
MIDIDFADFELYPLPCKLQEQIKEALEARHLWAVDDIVDQLAGFSVKGARLIGAIQAIRWVMHYAKNIPWFNDAVAQRVGCLMEDAVEPELRYAVEQAIREDAPGPFNRYYGKKLKYLGLQRPKPLYLDPQENWERPPERVTKKAEEVFQVEEPPKPLTAEEALGPNPITVKTDQLFLEELERRMDGNDEFASAAMKLCMKQLGKRPFGDVMKSISDTLKGLRR